MKPSLHSSTIRRTGWLALLVVSAVGGWFFGRLFVDAKINMEDARRVLPSHRLELLRSWMAKVKKAAPSDFPKLAEECETIFEDDDSLTLESRRMNALCWLDVVWLTKDPDGFFKAATDGGLNYSYPAAKTLVLFQPDKTAEWLFHSPHGEQGHFFARDAVQELAKQNPSLYLKMDPNGTADVTPGLGSQEGDWLTAVSSLAKTDALAAANACLGWKGENDPNSIFNAFLAVAREWKVSAPSFAQWVEGIAAPQLHNFASHARLCALAEKDPKAALAELYSTKLEQDNDLNQEGPRTVLIQLAKADIIEALKLLKEVEHIFSKYRRDPFAEPSVEEAAAKISIPFSHLSPGRYFPLEGGVENNGVRHAILGEAAGHLPDEPIQLFAALHKLRTDLGDGDSTWQRGIEAELIRLKSAGWRADACLEVTKLWSAKLNGERDDVTMHTLAARAARTNPEKTLAVLQQLPEYARPSFAAEIIKNLAPSDPKRSIALFTSLTATQWDKEFGEALGRNAESYASTIASLPAATTLGARQSFMEKWGEVDPEAAAQWLRSLPEDAASIPTAAGLAMSWASYDKQAASAWASTLQAGLVHDGAAASLANSFAGGQPDKAWHWAATVSDAKMRAKAFDDVAYRWRDKAPEEFRAAYWSAIKAAGLLLLERGNYLFQ